MLNQVKPVNLPEWINVGISAEDVVLSSRVRLARNLAGVPFPQAASRDERVSVMSKVRDAVLSLDEFRDHTFVELEQLSPLDRQLLLEEHIISPVFAGEVSTGRAFSHDSRKVESLMINEEDHLRLQVIASGFDLRKSWGRANILDDALESVLTFAFSSEFGYKTACPTNMGTGMRASVMLHVPGHGISGFIKNLTDYLKNMGFLARGLFGEGTDILGHIIQISNQTSQNISEDDILQKLERVTGQIRERELDIREQLYLEARHRTEDRVWRDFATLSSARILPIEEFMDCYSMVRMGIQTGILPAIPAEEMNQLMLFARPTHLQLIYGPTESGDHLDFLRGELSRSMLSKCLQAS